MPIRAVNSPVRPLLGDSRRRVPESAWMAKADGETTSLSNASETAANMKSLPPGIEAVTEAKRSIGNHLDFYNARHLHSSLDGVPPDQFYSTSLLLPMAV